jgi:enamine deaminase RidA (YjgF/YER057c/UK114 family)
VTVARPRVAGLPPGSGFSHVVTVTDCTVAWLAGQLGTDTTGELVPGGLAAQFEQALRNVLTALTEVGGTAGDLVNLTVYTVDVAAYRAVSGDLGAAWRALAGRQYPAMAVLVVRELWTPAALVELQAVAAVPR